MARTICARAEGHKKVKDAYNSSSELRLTVTGRQLPYGITLFYMPPDAREHAPP